MKHLHFGSLWLRHPIISRFIVNIRSRRRVPQPIRQMCRPCARRVHSPDLKGQTGIYLDGKRPERAKAQAYDTAARERLRTLSIRLTNLPAGE
jgi:hypothetical protein